jgi:hypothetical protein
MQHNFAASLSASRRSSRSAEASAEAEHGFSMHDRLISNVTLITAPLTSRLVSEAVACSRSLDDGDVDEDLASLAASSLSGKFGARDLAILERELVLRGNPAGIARSLVSEALQEASARRLSQLSPREVAAEAEATAAADARREHRRNLLRTRAAHREYRELTTVGMSGSSVSSSVGVFGSSGGAALGGGLVIAVVSAALFGFYIGSNIWGKDSAWVRFSRMKADPRRKSDPNAPHPLLIPTKSSSPSLFQPCARWRL